MKKFNRLLLKVFVLSLSLGAHWRSTCAQPVPSKENVAALRYDTHDPPPPQIRQEDIDRVKLQVISAQLGATGVEHYSKLDQVEKSRMFIQAALPTLKPEKQNESSLKRAQQSTRKQIKQMMWTWHLTVDSFGSDPRFVNGLLDMLESESIESTRIVQDYFAAHPGKIDEITPYELLNLYARVSAAVLSQTRANVYIVCLADLLDSQSGLPSTQTGSNPIMNKYYLIPKKHRDSLRMTFQNEQEMDKFYETHQTEVELVEGIRNQWLLWSLRLLLPETVQSWGDPTVFEWNDDSKVYFTSAEDEFQKAGRAGVSTVLGPKALNLFDAGLNPVTGGAASSPEERKINQHRIYAIADVIRKLSGLIPDLQRVQASGAPGS